MNDVVDFPYVEAKWKNVLPARAVDLWVIHDMESQEKGDTAESVAQYFTRNDDPGSAHLNFDSNSCVRSVHDKDIAFGAPFLNHNGIHAEHAGRAAQTKAQWLDSYGRPMLSLSASVCAMYCLAKGWPATYRTAADLKAGGMRARGITTHLQGSIAFVRGGHTDPGDGFPIAEYVTMVQQHISGQAPPEVVSMRIPNLVGKDQTPSGGLYMAGADGGIFTFHGAPFLGNMVGKPMNAPVVDIVCWSDAGYWLIGADGGIFSFGDAPAVTTDDPEGNQVHPYTALGEEYATGAGAIRFGMLSHDRKFLTLLRDDLHDYNLVIS